MAEKQSKAPEAAATVNWFDPFWADTDYEEAPAEVGKLPPRASTARPMLRKQTAPDLSGRKKIWELIGEGNAGKTLLARWMGGEMLAHSMLDTTVLAALAPGNRNLTRFFQTVMQPDTSDPRATAIWAQKALLGIAKRQLNGIFDYGGGDASKALLIEAMPSIVETLEQQGVALIAAYLLTPRTEDLVYLRTFEEMGFQPRATALVLNLSTGADDPSVFSAIRNHPVYKAALDRGAVELWMPALDRRLSLLIERNLLHFRQARDGIVPEGLQAPVLGMVDRLPVRDWLLQMDEAFSPVRSWLPW